MREPTWRRYVRFWRSDLDADIDDELRFHFEARIEELLGQGLSAEAARARALEEFGDPWAVRARLRAIDRRMLERRERAAWWDALRQDARYAFRGVWRERGFAAAVVLTLALGIGANAAMFGVMDRLLLRPPAHVRDADRVARVYFNRTYSWAGPVTMDAASYPDYAILRKEARSFAGVAAFFTSKTSLGSGPDARQVRQTAATASFFPVLGVRPERGRFFSADEDRVHAAAPVAVLAHAFWRRQFGADARVLGKTLRLGNRLYTVVGVAPAGFTGVELEPVDVWVPMSAVGGPIASDAWSETRNTLWLRVLVRLRPGVSRAQASAEATALFRRSLAEAHRRDPDQELDPTAGATLGSVIAARAPARGSLRRAEVQSARVAKWLAGMAGVVLLIACGNVANLLLARAARRRREIAVRVALGVGRARLAGQLLTEGTVLALLGGAAGLALAAWGGSLMRAVLLPSISWDAPPLDARVLAFATAATLGTALLIGLAPALQASRPDVVGALKAGARGHTIRRSRTSRTLLVTQAALSVVLLVGAGLFVRSLRTVTTMDMGFDPARVLVAKVDLGSIAFEAAQVDAYYSAAHERVRAIPGVESVAIGMAVPFHSSASTRIYVPGRDSLPQLPDGGPYADGVTPDYFQTLGVSVVRGRGFTDADTRGAARVVVVNRTMARLVWPRDDALGKCIKVGADTAPCSEVVGIVEDAHRQNIEPVPVMQFYVPLAQEQVRLGGMRALFVRAGGDPAGLIAPVRHELSRLAPNLPFVEVHVLRSLIAPQVQPWRLGAAVFTAFGVLALAIAAVGLYGVIAYDVTQRTHEFGIRMALGAGASSVAGLVLRQGMQLAIVGIALGMAAALAASGRIAPLLFHTSPTDPGVLAVVVATLLAVSVAASLIPARRATKADPLTAMRAE